MESHKNHPLTQDAAQPASGTQPNLRPETVRFHGRRGISLGRSLVCICVREGVRPRSMLETAVAMAMENPEFFDRIRDLETAKAAARRAHRLRRRTLYRHRKIL